MVMNHFPFSSQGTIRMSGLGRVAVITGASSGLGRALAKELAREGYAVGVLARRREPLEQLTSEIQNAGGRAELESADVAERIPTLEAIHCLPRAAWAGRSSGCLRRRGAETYVSPMNVEEVERMMRVNLFGVIYAIEAVLPDMLKRGRGHVAAVASLAAYKGFPGQGGYCTARPR